MEMWCLMGLDIGCSLDWRFTDKYDRRCGGSLDWRCGDLSNWRLMAH